MIGEKPAAPRYDPELTLSDCKIFIYLKNKNFIVILDNTCGDGSCAYVGGDLASTFADLVSNSSEIIEVECCNSGGIIDDTIRNCGNGTSCSTICGPDTGNSCVKTIHSTISQAA